MSFILARELTHEYPMIDSAGNTVLKANGTIFDIVPMGKVVLLVGSLLVGLFSIIKPEASYDLNGFWRTVFWSLHIGLGLFALWISSSWLRRGQLLPCNTWAAVSITGLCGVAVAAPAYLALDVVFSPHLIDLDRTETGSNSLPALVIEVLDLSPWFLLTWAIINLPILLPTSKKIVHMDDSAESVSRMLIAEDKPVEELKPSQQFLQHLPGVVGTDIVAIASDLHYLNVWTVAGKTTVLGNLKDVVIELGACGMQVHRSHWVAHRHVRRIIGNSGSAVCILSNELKVPISRRRWKTVRDYYGRGVVHNKT